MRSPIHGSPFFKAGFPLGWVVLLHSNYFSCEATPRQPIVVSPPFVSRFHVEDSSTEIDFGNMRKCPFESKGKQRLPSLQYALQDGRNVVNSIAC